MPICVRDEPQWTETADVDREAPFEFDVPRGLNGCIAQPDDVDGFAFTAEKGGTFVFEVEARRYGSPLDAVLEIYNEKDDLLAEADDTAQPPSKDPTLTWTAPADGDGSGT